MRSRLNEPHWKIHGQTYRERLSEWGDRVRSRAMVKSSTPFSVCFSSFCFFRNRLNIWKYFELLVISRDFTTSITWAQHSRALTRTLELTAVCLNNRIQPELCLSYRPHSFYLVFSSWRDDFDGFWRVYSIFSRYVTSPDVALLAERGRRNLMVASRKNRGMMGNWIRVTERWEKKFAVQVRSSQSIGAAERWLATEWGSSRERTVWLF